MALMLTATEPIRDEHADVAPAPRVLVFRSCRMPQFLATVNWIREQWPNAVIDVVTSAGFHAQLGQAGAARLFVYSGATFGAARNLPLVRRLRAEAFDHIVIPQMSDVAGHHANLYRAAAAIGAGGFVVAPMDATPVTIEPRAFGWLTLRASFERVVNAIDVPLLLVLLSLAYLRPRTKKVVFRGRRRVLHVITSFGVGGAQVQLAELLARTPKEQYDVEVLVLGRQDGDFSRQWMARDDVKFHYSSGWPRRSLAVLELARLCQSRRYDLVHTWLFMANVIGAAGARLGGVPRIIGSVRNLSLWKKTWYAQWWFRIADALASRVADQVTVNATPLAADHAAWTWMRPARLAVIPNGLDPARIVPHAEGAYAWLRRELNLPIDTPIAGTVGRLAPEKDHAMVLRAVATALRSRHDLHAVIVGDGALRQALERLAEALGITARVHFMGERTDSRRITAGLDVFALTSRIEGFPNVLLEAAFLAVPSIATDIGGAGDVLDPEDLMEPGDAGQASRLMLARLARRDRACFHAAAVRRRAFDQFTAAHSSARWLALYDRMLTAKGDGQ
jgi:glycosyltransferase involved in cell wall biosynthesis